MRILFASLFLLSACSAPALKPAPAKPRLLPVAIASSPAYFATYKGLHEVRWNDRTFRFFHAPVKLKGFEESWQNMYGFGPYIEIKRGKEKKALDLREKFSSHYIARVFHDERSQRLLVLLDGAIEGPSPAYTVWISDNGGESWFQGEELPRPSPGFPPSELISLMIGRDGRGEALFEADEGNGQQLIYKLSTSDGGQNWSGSKAPALRNGLKEAKKIP